MMLRKNSVCIAPQSEPVSSKSPTNQSSKRASEQSSFLNEFFVLSLLYTWFWQVFVSKFSILLRCLFLSQEHMVLSTGALESDLTLYRMILTLFFLWKRILSGFRSFSFSYAFQNKTVYVYKNLPNFEGNCIKPIYQRRQWQPTAFSDI